MKMTHESFVKKLKLVHGIKYTPLEKYATTHAKLKIKCDCSNIFMASPNKLLSGRGCPDCGRQRTVAALKSDTSTFKSYVSRETNGDYSLQSEYAAYYEKVTILHNICGHAYLVTPFKFKSGTRCPKCAIISMKEKKTHSHEQFLVRFKKLHLDKEFKLLTEYKNSNTKISLSCKKCNNVLEVLPCNLTSNLHKCPKCNLLIPNQSNKSKLIEAELKRLKFNYIKEVRLEECKYVRPLPFDFALIDFNTLIEYDGELHFRAYHDVDGENKLKLTRRNDIIKNTFCIENNICLLRIPYTVSANNIIDIINELRTFNDQSSDVLYKRIEEMGGIFIHKAINKD